MTEVLKRTWAEINLDDLRFNYNQIRKSISHDAKLCCVVKADAYGHGALTVAKELESLGADYLAVSNLEEALQIRLGDVKCPVLILGYTPANCVDDLYKYNITQCVYSEDYAVALSRSAEQKGVTLKVHLKLDTGMNRIGVQMSDELSENEIEEICQICNLPNLDFEGVFTHFAVADEGDDGKEFTFLQAKRFKDTVDKLSEKGINFEICHCANSAAVLDYPEIHFDMVRAGIINYGLYPSGKIKNKVELHPVLMLKSAVSNVKTIKAGDTVSYGRVFTAEKKMKIITVPIGYADGYPRILSNGADVLVKGKRCKILGRICMDQLMANAELLEDVKIGDEVTLIGSDEKECITADELAVFQQSINYEVVCDIGKRVPRVYIKNGEIVSISNQLLPNLDIK